MQKATLNSRMLDVVSLIEMRDEAQIVFEGMPLDSNLFNRLMLRRKPLCLAHTVTTYRR